MKKLKVIEINSCNYGSTGNIMLEIADLANKNDIICYTACPKSRSNMSRKVDNCIYIGNIFSRNIHIIFSKLTGLNGFGSFFSTLFFLHKINKISPDIIHLHNLHNSYINLPLLFRYIKKRKIRVIWTLHDCWAITGHCPHFSMISCNKWKNGCYSCPSFLEYPTSYIDSSKLMWKYKKKMFSNIEKMQLVLPSNWLLSIVNQSFLGNYEKRVIYNGIDLNIFNPISSKFKDEYNIKDSIMLLGVSFSWGEKKGLDVFIELSKKLSDDFKIVLVGTNDEVDKMLPNNIISIHKTNNREELAKIYSAADIFINPTREEVLGLVNIESLACGTPVITFNSGGSPECIDEKTGIVCEKNTVDDLIERIKQMQNNKYIQKLNCIDRAKQFDKNEKYKEYINLYKGE